MGVIYKATNKIDNKIYIGKTIKNLKTRKQNHLSHSDRDCSFYFHRAIRKHGFDNFKWEILCETDCENKLNALEKFYIICYRKMNILYNLTDGGEGVSGRIVSEKTKEKLRKANKGQIPWTKGRKLTEEHKKKLSESKKNPSKETLEKMSNASKGRNLGAKLSEEHKTKISESGKGRITSDKTRNKLSLSKIGDKNPSKRTDVRKKISNSLKKYNEQKRNRNE